MELWQIILIIVSAVVVIATIIVVTLKLNKNKRINESEKKIKETIDESTTKLADCFGGKENIDSIDQIGSRVSVKVKDPLIVNKEAINKELPNVMYMGNKIIFVIGSDSIDFKSKLDEKISSK